MIGFNYEGLKDRIYACWIGKNIGGTMGTPYEGTRELLDIPGFSTKPGVVLPNDDLDLQLVWLMAAEKHGLKQMNAHLLAEYWVGYIVPHWNEYGYGKANLRAGLLPPLSGEYNNEWKHSNGAWIRTEIWACMAPGCPDTAAKYAIEDAAIDHGMAEGTMAAAFVAAVESAAFVVKDLRKLIEIGFSKIPADSRVARAVKLVCDCYDQGIGWKEARRRVLEDSADLGWFEAPANVAFVVLGLLYGEGDFKKSMIYAINCGDDTDCTGATIGSVMGILYGTAGIPDDWRQHIGDDIVTVSINKGAISGVPNTCAELTERVCRMIPVMLWSEDIRHIDIHADGDCADAADVEKFKGGNLRAQLEERPGMSVDYDFIYMKARIIYDDEPEIAPGGEIRMRAVFTSPWPGIGPAYLTLRWILPEGWSTDCRQHVQLPHCFPDFVGDRRPRNEISFTLRAGERVEAVNHLILQVICDGHPTPSCIPVEIFG